MTVAELMFQKIQDKLKAKILAQVEEMIRPLVDEGRKAYEEYVEAERRLKDEKFSRN